MSDHFQEARGRLFDEQYRIGAGAKARHLLEKIAKQHIFCTLFFDDYERSYSSVLLPPLAEDLLPFDLPLDLPTHIKVGTAVTVLARVDGVISGFRTQMQKREPDTLLLDFPESLYQMQRRQLYRVPPAIADPDQVSILRRGAESQLGRLQDISVGGLRILLRPAPKDFPIEVGEELPELRFQLRDSPEIQSAAQVRFSDLHSQHGEALVFGVEFLQLAPTMKEIIAQYVQTRDREILKSLGIGLPGSGGGVPKSSLGGKLRRWWRGA